ncbi:aspartate-semialdehyde dehydrogenase [Syntrophothermus lipocalidus]|uniref:Aspartate-semialdehyde dehydrogenase n=1 Tax=Syntrophothermus lipocalidus (strain DSM 12680 / TGB-C1) TaxID=643648 RepID=D7CM69_SYNLT|nr:aspartate-semialdehyde dehydrogenase [Syntrophothermus lipocalidus]ADI01804.1 aspartate-semialdehyde dehydrogenase [Syntrophothermus lipocalidus DSM 12680]
MAMVKMAVVGATGAVGREMLKVLEERDFPVGELVCLADPKEEGNRVKFKDEDVIVRGASPEAFSGIDIVLLAVASEISEALAPEAVKRGCVVIDNSYAFRLREGVPLVVPEVNAGDVGQHQGIIANPNCSTIIMVVAVNPIHQAAGIKRIVVSTYQAVSGAGILGIEELTRQTRAALEEREEKPEVFQYPIAFNLIPHIDTFQENGYTKEEMKMVWETRKIMHLPDLRVSPTTVRVPVYRSHSESINIETERKISAEEARGILAKAPGVVVQDDPGAGVYPMPLYTSFRDEVFVGRIREDVSVERGLNLWVAADQIRKGAATNAVQIAEIVVRENLF